MDHCRIRRTHIVTAEFAQKNDSKKNEREDHCKTTIETFLNLFERGRGRVRDSVWNLAKSFATGNLLNFGRHTISGGLVTLGRHLVDWNSAYRLFSRNRIKVEDLFQVNLDEVNSLLKGDEPFRVLMDDTLLKKSGRKMPGATIHRDPLGPKYRPNFVLSQRFVQASAVLEENCGTVRAIPIGFYHTPSPKKPKQKASPEELAEYKSKQQSMRLPQKASQYIQSLRKRINPKRLLEMIVDGGYTNMTVLRTIPCNTAVIGRIRKDAKLFGIPIQNTETSSGRKRFYGEPMPTPEETRLDNSIPWTEVSAFVSGKMRTFDIKAVKNLRSKMAGERNLTLVIVRPIGYRLSQKSKILYRDPAYLICTDETFSGEKILKDFLGRWQIEINFREEKTTLGIDEPQVRNENSVENVPGFMVATYGMLLLAGHKTQTSLNHKPALPKWRNKEDTIRFSGAQYVSLVRGEIMNKSRFTTDDKSDVNPLLFQVKMGNASQFAAR